MQRKRWDRHALQRMAVCLPAGFPKHQVRRPSFLALCAAAVIRFTQWKTLSRVLYSTNRVLYLDRVSRVLYIYIPFVPTLAGPDPPACRSGALTRLPTPPTLAHTVNDNYNHIYIHTYLNIHILYTNDCHFGVKPLHGIAILT